MERMKFTDSMKLAELISLNWKLLSVLSRLGIGLGFGESTIREACGRHGINPSSFLLICSVYTYDDYIPSADMLKEAEPLSIVEYLHNSHSFYLDKEFVSLEKNMNALAGSCEAMRKKILVRFFDEYKTQVQNHFAYEENVVFPYVRALVEGKRTESYSIEQFEENHTNIDEALNDLKNIVMKYMPETCDAVSHNEMLYGIFRLEDDLRKHTVIEDSVLIPIVNRLEEK